MQPPCFNSLGVAPGRMFFRGTGGAAAASVPDGMRPLCSLLCLLAMGLVDARPAAACLNGVIMEQEDAARLVARAERDLERGNYRRVLRSLQADHYSVNRPLMRKISTLQAVAHLRLGNARAAERRLRRLLRHDEQDPYLLARFAESLAERKGERAIQAWRILDDLEQRDLIPDAHAYAALARLRERAGDAEGQARAVRMCHLRASDRSICPGQATAARS